MIQPFLPMLAVPAAPFDAPDYLFEVKWDGIRALVAREADGWRLWGRALADYRPQYPELAVLRGLPVGTVLDGEIVSLVAGRPDLDTLLARHARTAATARRACGQQRPVTYVVFDALYEQGRCLFGRPLAERRALAEQRVQALQAASVVFSAGVRGTGTAFFAQAVRQGQEGVLAKHWASRYVPGRRSAAWKKIKPVACVPAVILGYVPGRDGVRGLFVAAVWQGQLRYGAALRRGLSTPVRRQLRDLLAGRSRLRPAVPCPEQGVWVAPEVYCQVRCRGWTGAGRLRGACFGGLCAAAAAPEPPTGR